MVEFCNIKKDFVQNVQEQSVYIEVCCIMDKVCQEINGDFISEGIVVCVYELVFDVFIFDWGFEKCVYCDQFFFKKVEFRKEKCVFEFYWEKGVFSLVYVFEDERFRVGGVLQRVFNVMVVVCQVEEVECVKKECEEVVCKQIEIGIIVFELVDVFFDDDEDNVFDIIEVMVGVFFVECFIQSVFGLFICFLLILYCIWLDFKVLVIEVFEICFINKEKYFKFFKLREEGGEYIQDVIEMMCVLVIFKMDFSKSLL